MKHLVVLAAVALVIVPTASGTEAVIYPGVGIGKVKLGMTLQQVKRALGAPQLVNERTGSYVEYAWDFGAWGVGLQNGRVVQVSTTSVSQKTKNGVGLRTRIERVQHAFPGGVCTSSRAFGSTTPPDPRFLQWYSTEYLTTRKGGAQTVFVFHLVSEATNLNPFDQAHRWLVTEVYVRQPFRPLPEFAQSWPYRGKVAGCR